MLPLRLSGMPPARVSRCIAGGAYLASEGGASHQPVLVPGERHDDEVEDGEDDQAEVVRVV